MVFSNIKGKFSLRRKIVKTDTKRSLLRDEFTEAAQDSTSQRPMIFEFSKCALSDPGITDINLYPTRHEVKENDTGSTTINIQEKSNSDEDPLLISEVQGDWKTATKNGEFHSNDQLSKTDQETRNVSNRRGSFVSLIDIRRQTSSLFKKMDCNHAGNITTGTMDRRNSQISNIIDHEYKNRSNSQVSISTNYGKTNCTNSQDSNTVSQCNMDSLTSQSSILGASGTKSSVCIRGSGMQKLNTFQTGDSKSVLKVAQNGNGIHTDREISDVEDTHHQNGDRFTGQIKEYADNQNIVSAKNKINDLEDIDTRNRAISEHEHTDDKKENNQQSYISDDIINPSAHKSDTSENEKLLPLNTGCYFVDLNILSQRLDHCQCCSRQLRLSRCIGVNPKKLGGWISIECENKSCRDPLNIIPLSKTHRRRGTTKGHQDFDVNTKFSSVMVHTGLVENQLRNLLCVLEVGSLDSSNIKPLSQEVVNSGHTKVESTTEKSILQSSRAKTESKAVAFGEFEYLQRLAQKSPTKNQREMEPFSNEGSSEMQNRSTSERLSGKAMMISRLVAKLHANRAHATVSGFAEIDKLGTGNTNSKPLQKARVSNIHGFQNDNAEKTDDNAEKTDDNADKTDDTCDTTISHTIISPVTGKPIPENQDALRSIYARLNKYGITSSCGLNANIEKRTITAKHLQRTTGIQSKKKLTNVSQSNSADGSKSNSSNTGGQANPGVGATPWDGSMCGRAKTTVWCILTIIAVLAYITCFMIAMNNDDKTPIPSVATADPLYQPGVV